MKRKRRLHYVCDDVGATIHRAFSPRQAAFCGLNPSPDPSQWLYWSFGLAAESKTCKPCERSDLNKELAK